MYISDQLLRACIQFTFCGFGEVKIESHSLQCGWLGIDQIEFVLILNCVEFA